jgi:hypothetical protein
MPLAKTLSWRASVFGYGLVVFLTAGFAALFANILLSGQAYYPAIDQRHFFGLVRVAHALIAGDPNAWLPFRESLPSQYNALFGLPLAPAFSIFGESYYVYGMSITLIYAVPGTLAVAGVAAFALADEGRGIVLVAFVATALCAITRSATWFSTRNYYPDIGDALVLALWLALAIALLRRPGVLRLLALIAASLCVVLFRRHLLFAWGASGIGMAIAASAAWTASQSYGTEPGTGRHMRVCMVRVAMLAASAIAALGIIWLLIPSFAREMASIAGADAYRDYERSPHDVMTAMLGVLGVAPLALSAAGYIAAALVFPRRRFEIIGIGIGGVLHLLFWIIYLRQIDWQYFVVPGVIFLPIGIGLGAAVLANMAWAWQRTVALTIGVVLLCASAGRLVYGAVNQRQDRLHPHLWQARVAPLVVHRGMQTPFLDVFSRIGLPARAEKAKIFVVASSPTLNEGIAQSASEVLLGNQASAYVFLWVPAVDARDRLPVTELLQADYVLVVRPPQTVLPTGFDGLNRVLSMFANQDRAARDFERLGDPVAFPTLSVTVYRRTHPSDLATAFAALDELRAAVPHRGFSQPIWVEVGQPSTNGRVEYWGNDAVIAHDRDRQQGWPAQFISYDLVSSPADVTGDGQTNCPDGVSLTIGVLEPSSGKVIPLATRRLDGDALSHPFRLSTPMQEPTSHLVMEIDASNSLTPCDVTLRHTSLKAGHGVQVPGGT